MNVEHLMRKVRDAAQGGINSMSTGEALAASLVLNRPDWLETMGYTIAEALNRLDEDAVFSIIQAEKQWKQESDNVLHAQQLANEALKSAELFSTGSVDETIHLESELVTYADAPGYRNASFEFDVRRIGRDVSQRKHRIDLRIRPQDAESIVRHLLDVHRFAWSKTSGDGRPLDSKEGEQRPSWIGGNL